MGPKPVANEDKLTLHEKQGLLVSPLAQLAHSVQAYSMSSYRRCIMIILQYFKYFTGHLKVALRVQIAFNSVKKSEHLGCHSTRDRVSVVQWHGCQPTTQIAASTGAEISVMTGVLRK